MRYPNASPPRYIKLEAVLLRQTQLAIHVEVEDVDGDKQKLWLPKSQVQAMSTPTHLDEITFELPIWLAEKNNLS